ncbi:uncharacterized protein Z520_07012 [Fonsecaea multimorphosa CBS 102226]|uniref:Isochorismatase-like domain-containing protein n=1 Tax=Fonsecaea multimorphosa CBS 102226 TaxID=1442371 RepID=A0A0D2K356_9EURO|nr:uncharacterized protein Z520_07012 [Fonsecaea multimorphosa CBS 102226]KIX97559.1 hypothetical protein Z520_07012 [Fonsecaea multimorphosa CBS 102226]OAL23516.1 hypothetical protein AYO22_06566 [Fonsecaea multimorphosa]
MAATALLVCDIQNGIVERVQGPGQDTELFLQRLSQTIDAARHAGLTVIYVRVAFRPGYPEASPRNASLARVKAHGSAAGFGEDDPLTQIHAAALPLPTDIVVTKRRVSALHGTDLDLVLRSLGVENLVIAGLSTSGVVMSTVRQAADMDYRLVVLADLCRDSDQEMHDAAMKVIAKQAEVVTSEDWVAGL